MNVKILDMKTYIIIIEKIRDGWYEASNKELGLLGCGENIEECKISAEISIDDIDEDFFYEFEMSNI